MESLIASFHGAWWPLAFSSPYPNEEFMATPHPPPKQGFHLLRPLSLKTFHCLQPPNQKALFDFHKHVICPDTSYTLCSSDIVKGAPISSSLCWPNEWRHPSSKRLYGED